MAPVSRTSNASKPTVCQPIRKNVMVELNLMHNKACMVCGRKEISEQLYGPLFKLDDVVIHHFCILLSSRSIQNGADNDGIYRFLLKDIRAELSRASKQNCFYCKKKGASILCCGGKCRKVFHLPCGLKNGSMHQYFQSFKSFCQQHRIQQTIDLSELKKSTSPQCAICKNDVIRSSVPTSIWAPCCKDQNFNMSQDCSICLGDIDNKSYTNACKHLFCYTCLQQWSKECLLLRPNSEPTCPICRKNFMHIYHYFDDLDIHKSTYTIPGINHDSLPSSIRRTISVRNFSAMLNGNRYEPEEEIYRCSIRRYFDNIEQWGIYNDLHKEI
ncbi:PHD finger protein 7-like [Metopolophium dirhodum]|uniref:PHD finger protein 7-like n=1 Tax=Metopolophium dirhodum TaxID=44670 RepID=UPI00298FB6FD|nr:PHD finger protein 7-like [Metopolophium dirhodum]